jgi:ABC-2 type transport system permease protein
VLTSFAAAGAVVKRDFLLDLSYRTRFLSQILTTFFSLALFYYISRLVTVGFASRDAYFEFAVVGVIIYQVVSSTLMSPPLTMRQELVAGTWERLVLSGFGAVRSVVALTLYPLARSFAMGIVTIVVAHLVFGLHFHWPLALLAVPTAIFAALAFLPFGVVIVGAVMIVKQAASGASWVIGAMSLVAGFYFPVKLLPDWIRWLSDVQPFTPAVELLRHLLVDTPLAHPAWLDLLKMAGFAAVLLPVSLAIVTAALRSARRRGTVIEY